MTRAPWFGVAVLLAAVAIVFARRVRIVRAARRALRAHSAQRAGVPHGR